MPSTHLLYQAAGQPPYPADGRLMRAVPKAGGVLYGIRPSYWDRHHQVPCELPQ